MSRFANVLIALLCVLVLVLMGCASTPKEEAPPERPQLRVLSHKCDQWGVSQITAVVTAAGVVTLAWDNAGVCGTPS